MQSPVLYFTYEAISGVKWSLKLSRTLFTFLLALLHCPTLFVWCCRCAVTVWSVCPAQTWTACVTRAHASISTKRCQAPPWLRCPARTPSSPPSGWAGSCRSSARWGQVIPPKRMRCATELKCEAQLHEFDKHASISVSQLLHMLLHVLFSLKTLSVLLWSGGEWVQIRVWGVVSAVQTVRQGPPGPDEELQRAGNDPQLQGWHQPAGRGGQQRPGETETGHQISPERSRHSAR